MEKRVVATIGVVSLIALALGFGLGFSIFSNSSANGGHKINNEKKTIAEESLNVSDFRLPLALIPFHYVLEIRPILEDVPGYQKFTAPGHVRISVECHEVTQNIILHASNDMSLSLSTLTVTQTDTGTTLGLSKFSYDFAVDLLTIQVARALEVGKNYQISIEFVARIPEDRLNGMYLDYHDDPDTGEKNHVATTLFAPYHARKAFPCFDEPNFRSTFDITVGRHNNYHAMSNGLLADTRAMPGHPNWYWDTFQTTPSISSYIIAIIVSNFDYEEAPAGIFRNVSVRTYATPYNIQRGGATYAVKLAADLLTYFESFFLIEYPLPKAYSVALPHFFFNAMENWGLITYKEPVILYFPNETSEAERYKINYVTSHELAHQWFGNLVNCKWWAYVWLKEGFATFYAHFGMNHTHPELEPWIQFPVTVMQVAMDFDTTEKTHPLENFPANSAAVADIYTRIPYEKGASILRMTSKFLTEDIFHAGIRRYVDQYQYKGAEQNDIFQALEDVSPEGIVPVPVKTIMDTWTTQSGFPLLRVAVTGLNSLLISQEKFIGEDTSNPDTTWWVPVTISPKTNPAVDEDYPDVWIPKDVRQVTVNMNTDQPIIVNPRSIGYYRVLYDTAMTKKIQAQLEANPSDIPSTARSQILTDYFNIAYAKYIPIEMALNFTKYLSQETEWFVWKSVLRNQKRMYNVFVQTEHFEGFRNYWLTKMESALHLSGGWPTFVRDGAVSPSKLQIELLEWLRLLESPSLNTRAQNAISKWKNTPAENRIIADFQSAVYCAAVGSDSDGNVWNFMYKQLLAQKSTVLKSRLVKSLSSTQNITLIERLLNLTRSQNSEIRSEDKTLLMEYIGQNPYAKSMTLDFIQQNFVDLKKSMKSEKPIIEALKTLSDFMSSTEELEKLQDFILERGELISKSGNESVDVAVKKVNTNIKWMKDFADPVTMWFKSVNYLHTNI